MKVGGDFPAEKIEEKNPEVLAKKILEQGRNLERSKTLLSPQSVPPPSRHLTQSVEVRRIEAPIHHQQQQPTSSSSSYKQTSSASQHHQLDITRYEHRQLPPGQQQQQRSDMVDLPKMEMNMSLVSSGMGPMNTEPPLVLPPHPPSRSASSDLNDDVTFSSSKMSSTPRAEQFETRLKNIIQSVLAGDADQEGPQMRNNSSPPPQQRPMFSPVKKELPSHLPLPPSGVVISSSSMSSSSQYHQREMMSPIRRPADLSAYPQTSSSRTMNDLIASEIEKSLSATNNGPLPPGKSFLTDYRGGAGPFSGLPSSSSSAGSRMSQVIEESIRGNFELVNQRPPAATKDLEGLACPRTNSRSEAGPTSSSMSSASRSNGGSSHDYPVEGLAARFGSQQRAYWQHPPGPPDAPPVQQQGYGRPTYGHPYPEGYRKRSSPTQMSPVLPPKKQHFDSNHPDYRGQKGN